MIERAVVLQMTWLEMQAVRTFIPLAVGAGVPKMVAFMASFRIVGMSRRERSINRFSINGAMETDFLCNAGIFLHNFDGNVVYWATRR